MLNKNNFFGLIFNSEKSDFYLKEKKIVLRISKDIDKKKIEMFINKVYNIKLININTLVVKGKKKRYKKYFGKRINFKKVYIYFKNYKDFSVVLNDKKNYFIK